MSQLNNLLLECLKNELELDYFDKTDIKLSSYEYNYSKYC